MHPKPLDMLHDFKCKKQHQQTSLFVFVFLELMHHDIFLDVARKYKSYRGKL